MPDQAADIERIQAYLKGQLSGADIQSFERRLEAEPALKELLEEVALSQAVARKSARQSLAEELKARYVGNGNGNENENGNLLEVDNNGRVQEREVKQRIYWPWLLAAAVFLFWMVFFRGKEVKSPEQLFAQYYELPAAPENRGEGDKGNWENARLAYQQGEWLEAAKYLQVALADSSFQFKSRAYFYLGICYLQLDQYQEASDWFNQVETKSLYYPQAIWYQGLSHLKAGEKEQSRTKFFKIQHMDGHYKQKEAEEILDEGGFLEKK